MARKTCRTCLKQNSNNDWVKLNNSNESLEIQAELSFCVPELNFHLIEDAYMCYCCVDSLHKAYLFKNECLRAEELIRNSVKSNKNNLSLEELNLNRRSEMIFDIDVVDELNSVLDEVLMQNLPGNKNLVLSNVVKTVNVVKDDSVYTFSQSLVQSRINLNRKVCAIKLIKEKLHPGETQYVCSTCNKFFRSRRLLNVHRHSLHGKQIKMKVTDADRSKTVGKLVPVKTNHYRCNVCDYAGKRKDYIKDHIKRSHKNYEVVYCPINGWKGIETEKHSGTSDTVTVFSTKVRCTPLYYVGNESGLRTHVAKFHQTTLTHHSSTNSNGKCICNICDKEFPNIICLKRHVKRHEGPQPFFCSRCRFRTDSKDDLKQHLIDHDKPKKFSCTICQFSSDHSVSVKSHEKRKHNLKRR